MVACAFSGFAVIVVRAVDAFWAAVVGAVVGGLLALAAAEWSFRRALALTESQTARHEAEVLDGLLHEIEVVLKMAEQETSSPLPIDFLRQATPLRQYMSATQRDAFSDYAQAVLRYNGRVERLVAYGAGKRAAGMAPGAEKPKSHAKEVHVVASAALAQLSPLAEQLRSAATERARLGRLGPRRRR
jgi:hypothetical protein